MAGVISAANLGGVADPRSGDETDVIGTTKEHRGSISAQVTPPELHGPKSIYLDNTILFEDYHYWANRSREVEKHMEVGNLGLAGVFNLLIGRKKTGAIVHEGQDVHHNQAAKTAENGDEKHPVERKDSPKSDNTDRWGITETEWENAQRATRTATWGSIFYLITTDILGPTNVPWAISQMGYGPGFALYTSFGLLACYSGLQLWRIFIGLDSTRYPMRNYGDVAFRIFGSWARHTVNVLQSFQFFLNVSIIIVSNGQGLAQMAQGKSGNGYICFVVAQVVFALAGFVLGQIRTLQRLAFLANLAIWLNVIVIIMTMAVVYKYPPNYEASLTTYGTEKGPIHTYANWPPDSTLSSGINGLMNCVFAYGGATLFNELMAEMRRPYDFWKGFVIAEVFIYCCYIISGMVTYSAQGQFTYNPAYQGIPNSAYSFQTLGNAISWITGLIAALLYGNIGVKVIYATVLRDILHFPPLDTKKGKWLWVGILPLYWGLAFIVAAAIPQLSNLISFVGAACILQFSYTFPPILKVGYNIQRDAVLPEETFDPVTGRVNRVDSGMKRWIRGFKKQLFINTFDVLYALAAFATAGLGLYASITSMHQAFSSTSITPFTCKNPAG